ncbi:UDP-N-acetylmuramate--L-alanine ligase [Nakamurella flavida]|uniref:UDP-N-acetylmuramate--L-alanine ligase n=1 Tax=Nakamurella flavida TaxID=363630 RepID=A0A938YQH1_9ACTN|nr:UDP-N-acetylmuramate--L-alanine ligase [Nakamurella flavida]MBM9477529.1 UDP-N-acetylmuramate--L-alanine ligase [Nakamurella flavida]MDP9777462.1 UDP-N-acetylmuramate--alanine ligase [Nakamurella flavida]
MSDRTPDGDAAPVTSTGASLARAFLVGVGGAGMSGIAGMLAERGLPVAGSDARESLVLQDLRDRGVIGFVGHDGAQLDALPGGPTAVVVSTAVRPDNPEVLAARERGIPVVRRAEALAALMADRRSVCVAGTHGKTSTTSMLTVALREAGLDPSFAIGGELNTAIAGSRHAHGGGGDVFVAEADESDGSFLSFAPHGAIVTNLEPDHLDHHGTAEAYQAVFDAFVDRILPGGFLVACAEDAGSAALAGRARLGRIVTYGWANTGDGVTPDGGSGGPDVRITRPSTLGAAATISLADGRAFDVTLPVPGEHMLLNAAAALAAGVELGADPVALARGLSGYGGVRRRFERKGSADGVEVYDDYAHHPTEVRAQIRAAREIVPADGRLVVVFQPHLYSRTAAFAAEFGDALGEADVVVLLDVYGAREEPVPGVTGALVAQHVPTADRAVQVVFHADRATAAARVLPLLHARDLVITMGAGDITSLGPDLLALLEDR